MSDAGHIGPYELRGELGRGAMARVWRAWDPKLEREVAIKEPLFDSRLPDDVLEEMARRFVQEGRTAAKLQHNGIVTIYAADVYDGRPAIVMELIEGVTLGKLLEQGPLDAAPALDALDQLLDAVGYAHGKGVVHRDIKPDNIFIDQSGQIKLSDFGIAHVEDASATKATVAGSVLGTPGYMAPEQATGGDVDQRSDLFSIGVVGYEMLAGANPFNPDNSADMTTVLYRIVHEPVPELPASVDANLPVAMRPAIMAALNKDPNARPQSAAAFKSMLHGGAVAPTVVAPTQLGTQVQKASGSRPKWLPYVIAGAACVVVLAIVFGIMSTGGGGGAVGGGSAATTVPSTTEATASESPVYIGPWISNVAIFTNSTAEPYKVSDIRMSELDESDKDAINEHIGFSTVEEAESALADLEEAVAATNKRGAVTETFTVTGEDGTTRTETIRLEGDTDRVISDSNTRPLPQSEINELTDAEKYIAWKEIIAAETGYMFLNRSLANWFNSRNWYAPNPSGEGECAPGVAADNVNRLKNSLDDTWWLHIGYP